MRIRSSQRMTLRIDEPGGDGYPRIMGQEKRPAIFNRQGAGWF